MSDHTVRCPNCYNGNLNTPYIRFTTKDGRKPKSIPLKFCRFCNIYIQLDKEMKIWNGKELVDVTTC